MYRNVHDNLVGLIACMLLGSKFLHVCSSEPGCVVHAATLCLARVLEASMLHTCSKLVQEASCVTAERHRVLHLLCITAMT